MKSAEIQIGRKFAVTFDHGCDFFEELTEFCRENSVKQGFIPMFLAGFSEAELIGACDKLENPKAPVKSRVYLTNIEVIGCGTVAYDEENQTISPHIHVSVGKKEYSADAHTSHLVSAKVQFLTEMMFAEVLSPNMVRIPNPELYDIGLLNFI